jgi:hypothetical protein
MRAKAAVAIVPANAQIPRPIALFHRIWPPAILVIGLILTAAWTAILGYGLVQAVALAL